MADLEVRRPDTGVADALKARAARKGISLEINAADALAATLDAIADGVIRLADDEALVQAAPNLALALEHKVLDGLYLALAEREGATVGLR